MRLAWFSPLAPSHSGIAAYSAELLPLLSAVGHTIETFAETTAHEYVWKQRRNTYDLTVFQLGNAACHDYVWAYLFRYPGLVVLHDAQLHQARALALTKRWQPRRDDYLAEFRANHPDAPPSIAEVVAAGFGHASLYRLWPHIKLVVETSRMTVVHNPRLADDLRDRFPTAAIEAIQMGVSDPLAGGAVDRRAEILAAHGIPADAVVLAAFGGLTPEKGIPSLVRALSVVAERHPHLHLLLVGAPSPHYDARDDARRWRVEARVHITGYVRDQDLPGYLAASDLCACLRWPSSRETSASWLRCLGAGRATIINDLADLGDVPSLDPRGWRVLDSASPARTPVTVSIDVVDEDHSLQLALDRLVVDGSLRARLGEAARRWWHAHHRLEHMAAGYERVLSGAVKIAPRPIALPPHLVDDTSAHGRSLAASLGVSSLVAAIFRD